MFDTLMYAKRLEASGMTRDQAEAQVNVIAEMVVDGVATKQDLALQQMATSKEFTELRLEMNGEFAAVRSEMQAGFAAVRAEMHAGFAAVRSEMHEGFSIIRSEMHEGFARTDEKSAALRTEMLRTMGAMFALSTTIIIGVISWVVK